MAVSLAKTKLTWTEAVVRGILCNWLVCIAISFANAAQDISGKFFGVFVPISAFIAMGFEHCVANQFIIPMGMTYSNGADIGRMFWYNLIPATIGNFIGGVFCLTVPYSLCYGSLWAHIENFTGIKWTHLDPGYPGSTYYPFDDEYKWSTEDCAPVAVSAAASVEAPVDKSSPPSSSSVAQLAHGLPYMAHPYGPPNPAAVYMTGVNAPRY